MIDLAWQVRGYLAQGGWIMAPLAAVSVAMWTLILDRYREFAAWRRAPGPAGRLDALFAERRSGLPDRPELDREILAECSLHLQRLLDSRLAAISILAVVAPLLGLLGTVLGMIQTFDVIAMFGTGNARALAGGISVALITTQTGLLIAIPGLFMSNRLNTIARRLKTTVAEAEAARGRALGGREAA
ncbi:MAG: MotA/TolQ/ExbB proton channel family protein [Candidatus Krumholzibacteriia bacterium]